jgi:Domain of unknown function (DUF6458)
MVADREVDDMGIGVSLFLLAIGAILTFAVHVTTEGFNLNTMGVILMIVGGVGLLFTTLVWGSWSSNRRDEHIVTREREVL